MISWLLHRPVQDLGEQTSVDELRKRSLIRRAEVSV
jgi:hypothetical protein